MQIYKKILLITIFLSSSLTYASSIGQEIFQAAHEASSQIDPGSSGTVLPGENSAIETSAIETSVSNGAKRGTSKSTKLAKPLGDQAISSHNSLGVKNGKNTSAHKK